MLSVEELNIEDHYLLDGIPKSIKASVILGSIIYIPLSFLIGLIGLTKKGIGYWQTTLLFLSLFIFVFFVHSLKEYLLYKKDVKRKLKWVGMITIKGKTVKRDKTLFHTDIEELKEFALQSNECSNQIEIGDTLTIQFTKFGKTLLLLEKNDSNLLNCN